MPQAPHNRKNLETEAQRKLTHVAQAHHWLDADLYFLRWACIRVFLVPFLNVASHNPVLAESGHCFAVNDVIIPYHDPHSKSVVDEVLGVTCMELAEEHSPLNRLTAVLGEFRTLREPFEILDVLYLLCLVFCRRHGPTTYPKLGYGFEIQRCSPPKISRQLCSFGCLMKLVISKNVAVTVRLGRSD